MAGARSPASSRNLRRVSAFEPDAAIRAITIVAQLRASRTLDEVQNIPRRLTFCLGLKYDIQIRGRSEDMQQRPEREPLTSVLGETEVDLHVIDAGIERSRRDCRQI